MAVMSTAPKHGAKVYYNGTAYGVNDILEKVKGYIPTSPEDLSTTTTSPARLTTPLPSIPGMRPAGGHAYSLRVGNGNDIPRWAKGTILTYSVDPSSFPRRQHRSCAKTALNRAAKQWNKLCLGVTLQLVNGNMPAVFQLVYEPDIYNDNDGGGTALAEAFPPDAPVEARRLVVYAKHFDPCYVDSMVNTFLHEIGHILGLRHEFEEPQPSVLFGKADALSVMNYPGHPRELRLQRTDIKWMQEFYAFSGKFLDGLPIKDVAARLR